MWFGSLLPHLALCCPGDRLDHLGSVEDLEHRGEHVDVDEVAASVLADAEGALAGSFDM